LPSQPEKKRGMVMLAEKKATASLTLKTEIRSLSFEGERDCPSAPKRKGGTVSRGKKRKNPLRGNKGRGKGVPRGGRWERGRGGGSSSPHMIQSRWGKKKSIYTYQEKNEN